MASRRTSGAGSESFGDGGRVAAAPGSEPDAAISVHDLTSAAKDLIEGAFPPLWVRGEVTNFKAHRNGHWYFSLRDANAQVNCVIWSSATRRIPAQPDEGMQVLALGQMTVWPVRGDLQFSVRQLEAEGDGLWRKALEQSRLRLERDGLLTAERKRRLPAFPRRIAVITSPDGAALRDVITVSRARSADVELVVVPAKVQGEGAADSLIDALERVGRWGGADLVIIGRGGGSREDLWAFNDERLARALAACPVPTISAVGHEVDISLCDLVADVRAATPSAAAEIAVPSRRELAARVDALGNRLASAAVRRQDRAVASLVQVRKRLALTATRLVDRRRGRIETLAGQLEALSPLATLARGFGVARGPDGATLSRRAQFAPGASFELWLQDGIVEATAGASKALPDERMERTNRELA
ncbi:MAG TPA: exodeoxyribonuclease VII large subunit [Gemmatimonas aurantiaca]|uniref:Exodeoxyribonuclease 7 large subunit n=1 Tax=Gemmatimonas aurantiaca TaxID=173480 RepID=A0A3D4V7U2_9BACT|nr:exodeoxyribonuclease VII large subunit [Gemmatimonas aurantiaca]HCT57203.1 exodeoxyribonuclease VII large subunit [Gemmatimonas aurantiaca]